MGKRHQYVGVVHEGMAMFFHPRSDKLIGGTICAAVMFTGDKRIVQRGQTYRKGEEPKGLQARADKMAEKWQGYFERTGKRWEVKQDAKRKAKQDKRKAESNKRRAVMEAGPNLLAMLERMVKAARFGDELPLIEADALIAQLK